VINVAIATCLDEQNAGLSHQAGVLVFAFDARCSFFACSPISSHSETVIDAHLAR
jgi:hypothetical protein